MLVERVTIIIHTAASVRFNDSLTYAILTNTRGTRDICILAQSMKNLIVSNKKDCDLNSLVY